MRTLLLVLLLVGSTHGLLGAISNLIGNVGNSLQSVTNQIGQTASNLWNGATNHVNNAVGTIVDTANGIQTASNFLWSNVFGPAYDMLIEGGQVFLDDKFGNIVSNVGRRSVLPENILSKKYAELTAGLKTNLHQLYEGLFNMQKEALTGLQKGEKNIEEKIRAFYGKVDEIQKQITKLAVDAKNELEQYALTVKGEWVHVLNQYGQTIDFSVKTMSQMFEKLTQNLIQTFVEAALSIVPNAAAIIQNIKQQGLLSFLNN